MTYRDNQGESRSSWYEQLYESPFIGLIIIDKDRRMVDVNPTFVRIFGYDNPEELIGTETRCLHVSDQTYRYFGEAYVAPVLNQKYLDIQYQFKKKDGSTFWAQITGQKHRQQEGILWTIVDIDAQVRAEEALRISEYKFRMLADSTFDWEYWIDQNDDYIFVSPACEAMTGYTAEEFIANPDLMIELARDDFKDTVREHFSASRDSSAPACSLEFPLTTRNGTEKWIEHNCKPLFDADGQPRGRYGNNRDMTERHTDKEVKDRLFQQVTEAKRAWEATMDCVDDLILVVDDEGLIKRCNNSAIRLLNCRYTDLFDQKWKQTLEAGGINFSPGGTRKNECHFTQGDRWFQLKKNQFRQDDGSGRTVITLHDMTDNYKITRELETALLELKQSQSKLLQSEKMASIGQLAAGVAHEINNPMGFISQNLKSLGKYVVKLSQYINAQEQAINDPSEERIEALKTQKKKLKVDFLLEDTTDLVAESLDGANRIQTIVNNLKTFSRVDQESLQQADLNECLDATINIIWNELKYKTQIEKDYGELPPVSCYPQQISQVFMNLLINASHAIEIKGTISLRTRSDGDQVLITIADNGCGISADHLQRIFEPFFTTKEPGKGTGLGLSMVYDIIKSHQGEISVASEVGQGTTFTISLPLSTEPS